MKYLVRLFVTIFAFIFLKEKVGIRRWTAVVIGFIGVIIVINPQNMNFNFLFISSIFLTIAYVFSVLTIFYAPLSLTATARYSVIIFGMIFGYIILKEIPTLNMIIGAIIITLSGMFVIKRQKDLGKIN